VALRLLLCGLCALGVAACGGGDDEADVQQAVRDFVEATNERDGDTLCGELLTQEFKEKATGATGDRVDELCKQQLELTKGFELELVKIGRTTVNGDRATVRTTLNTDGVQAPRVFSLEKEDGAWRLAAGSSG
jgi:Domain of unknown function (DUF4878)